MTVASQMRLMLQLQVGGNIGFAVVEHCYEL